MASKKGSKKMTMAQAFNAAQGPAVARPYGKTSGSGQGPAVGRSYNKAKKGKKK